MITDEMVDKALVVWWKADPDITSLHGQMRAALEAVAPMLIADVQRELDACNGALTNSGAAYALVLADRDKLIAQGLRGLIRAQKIDPK